MLQYEHKQMNRLIDEKYDLVNMLNSTIDSALSIIQEYINEDKQEEALKLFTKRMISSTITKNIEELKRKYN